MSDLSPDEEQIFNVAKSTLPRFLFQSATAVQELFAGAAKIFSSAKDAIDFWVTQSFIKTATSFWLDQHAKDRGTYRQDGESDSALQTRLTTVEDLVTKPVLLSNVNAVLAGYSLPETAYIVEMRTERGFIRAFNGQVNTIVAASLIDGETFTLSVRGTSEVYEFDTNASVGGGNIAVDISAAVTAADVSAAIILAITTSSALVTAATNAIDDTQVLISPNTINQDVILSTTVADTSFTVVSGKHKAYCSRGVRVGRRKDYIIIVLPFGTSTVVANSVAELMRIKKAGGVAVTIERRLS